jgi:hypothetical protein
MSNIEFYYVILVIGMITILLGLKVLMSGTI